MFRFTQTAFGSVFDRGVAVIRPKPALQPSGQAVLRQSSERPVRARPLSVSGPKGDLASSEKRAFA